MVEPLTTVAGLMPLTRTGAQADGEFANQVRERGLAHVVGLAAALGHDGVGGAGEHDGAVEACSAKSLAASSASR
jgi:hypothetical protein